MSAILCSSDSSAFEWSSSQSELLEHTNCSAELTRKYSHIHACIPYFIFLETHPGRFSQCYHPVAHMKNLCTSTPTHADTLHTFACTVVSVIICAFSVTMCTDTQNPHSTRCMNTDKDQSEGSEFTTHLLMEQNYKQ